MGKLGRPIHNQLPCNGTGSFLLTGSQTQQYSSKRAKLVVLHQVTWQLCCEPEQGSAAEQSLGVGTRPQPRRRTGCTSLLPQFPHLKQQHLPISHQSTEKVNSCMQSAFKMKACFLSLLSAMAVILTEI